MTQHQRESQPSRRDLPARQSPPLYPLRPRSARHIADPMRAARAAGLRYVTDHIPGIQREHHGRGFRYTSPDGAPVHDRQTRARIRSLAVPPAWRAVWICPDARGHLQATGRDAKGRKQYRYHPLWRAMRDDTKYGRMVAFGEALPGLRQRVARDMRQSELSREKVLATVLRLLDVTRIRVGNEEYARDNQSFGLTTLRNDHVAVRGTAIRFQFRGKSGKEHTITVRDRRLARIVKRCQEIPGHLLFEYRDAEGLVCGVSSDDVNQRLRELTGSDFTAKDFRTWSGTVLTARALVNLGSAETATQAKQHVAGAIKVAAAHLGNTPAICRKSYVHPGVIAAYQAGALLRSLAPGDGAAPGDPPNEPPIDDLSMDERAVLALLRCGERQARARQAAG